MQSTPPVRATLMLLPHRLQHAFFLVFMVTTIVNKRLVKTIVNSTNVSSHNLTWHFDRFWHDILTDFDMTLWQMLTSVTYLLIYPWHWFWWLLVLDYFTWTEEVGLRIWYVWKHSRQFAMLIMDMLLDSNWLLERIIMVHVFHIFSTRKERTAVVKPAVNYCSFQDICYKQVHIVGSS